MKQGSKKPRKFRNALYIFSGMVSLLLAYIGIIIPGFPGIPFIVLAAYFFTNSSPKLYDWMMRQPMMKKLLNKSRKINRNVFKGLLISQVWFSVGVVQLTLLREMPARVLVAGGGIVLTVLVLVFMRKHHSQNSKTSTGDEND